METTAGPVLPEQPSLLPSQTHHFPLSRREKLLLSLFLLSSLFFFTQVLLIKFWEDRHPPLNPLASNISAFEPNALLGEATESADLSTADVTEEQTTETETEELPQDPVTTEPQVSPPPIPTPSTDGPPPPANYTASKGRINFPNNKFGVYAYAGADQVELAAELVNSNGGDWGWILMPMDIGERNSANWNGIFAKSREKHLIPIIQVSKNNIAAQVPSESEIDGIAEFLSGLGWPTKIRPVTLFNEVNAGEYWGGKPDPEGYARVLNQAIDKFHSLSGEFFVMNGAFNSSAHTTCTSTDIGGYSCYLGLDEYMRRMNNAVPGIFGKLDGWANHSYPHPSYGGTPWDSNLDEGRLTIRAYRYDLRLLAQYGVSLPVFITETGWVHKQGKQECPSENYLKGVYCKDQNTVAEYYKAAFNELWLKDTSVVAVTPFQLRRDDADNFAFVGADGSKFPQWDAVVSIPKVAGAPPVN